MMLKLLLAAALATGVASAQGGMGGDTGGGGGRGGRGGGDASTIGAPPRVQKPSQADQVVDKLKLNKDLKNEFEALLEEAQKEAAPVRQKLLETRNAIAVAMVAGKGKEEIDPLLKNYAAVSAEMTGIETRILAKICAKLKPNQQAKAGQAFDLMAEIFDSPDLVLARSRNRGR